MTLKRAGTPNATGTRKRRIRGNAVEKRLGESLVSNDRWR